MPTATRASTSRIRKQGETDVAAGDAAGAAARRADLPAQRLQSRDAEHVRRQHPRSRAGHRLRGALRADRSRRRQRTGGERDQDRHGAHASRADAGDRRQGLPRLPDEVEGTEDRAGVRRDHVRLQLLLRRRRHRAGRPAARQTGRHHPGPRRHLRVSLRVLRQPDHGQRDDHLRRHLLPDGQGHAREADRRSRPRATAR